MKDIIITGGLGFIGHNLAKAYLNAGVGVRIVDNLTLHSSQPLLTKYRIESLRHEKCSFFQHDIRDIENLVNRFNDDYRKPRALVHLASYPNQASVKRDPQEAINNMIGGAWAAAELAKHLQIKLVHVSSSMVYGNFTQFPQSEYTEPDPKDSYGLLKKQTEEIVKFIWGNSVIIRPSAVYGPGDNCDRVIGKWIKRAFTNQHPLVINNAQQLLDFTYIDDLVQGLIKAEELGVAQETYNIARGEARTLNEAAMEIINLTNSKSKVILEYGGKPTAKRGPLDISKAENELNYRPKVNLHDGLSRYLDWANANRQLIDD